MPGTKLFSPVRSLSSNLSLFLAPAPFPPLRPISSKWYLDVTKTFVSCSNDFTIDRGSRAVLREPLKGTIANDKGEDKGILIYKGTDSRALSVYLQSEKANSC